MHAQARIYASRPGHAAVANVGLKGVFFKDNPSYDELVLQIRWATAHCASTFLPTGGDACAPATPTGSLKTSESHGIAAL